MGSERLDIAAGGMLVGLAIVALGFLACTPFGAESPGEGGGVADGGGASDGPFTSDGPSPGPRDGGVLPPGTFVENFDVVSWEQDHQWLRPPGDTVPTRDEGASSSMPASLLLLLSTPPAPHWIRRPIVTASGKPIRNITASVLMQIETKGDGDVDFFGITTAPGQPGIYITNLNMVGLKIERTSQQSDPIPPAITFQSWTRIELDIDLMTRKLSVTFDDGQTPVIISPTRFDPLPVGSLSLYVGAFFNQAKGQWKVRFDDVTLLATE